VVRLLRDGTRPFAFLLRLLFLTSSWLLSRDHTHNLVSELFEQSTLKGFGCIITDHILSRTPFESYVSGFDSIRDEEISNIDVLRALTARSLSILLQKDGTLIVLMDYIVLHCIPLRFHEKTRPTNSWHEVIYADDLGLGRASGIEFLFGGSHNWKSTA